MLKATHTFLKVLESVFVYMVLGSFLFFFFGSFLYFCILIFLPCLVTDFFLHRYYKSFRDSKIFVVAYYAFDFLATLRNIFILG